jgi:acetyltransferase-like isoleucine patch superfamily enzyme
MNKSLSFYPRSVMCSIWFRLNGFQSSIVGCDGRLPVIDGSGTIRIGKRFVVRGRVAAAEIAARKSGRIEIGDRTFLNQGAVIAAEGLVKIGDDCQIGDFSAIYDSNYHRLEPDQPDQARPVTIGNNVWLGRNVLVLPGSEIGDHTVVAAQSVVRGILPDRVLAAGNPAKVIRKLENIPDGWRRGSG